MRGDEPRALGVEKGHLAQSKNALRDGFQKEGPPNWEMEKGYSKTNDTSKSRAMRQDMVPGREEQVAQHSCRKG